MRKRQRLNRPRRRYKRPTENISVERLPTMRLRGGGRDSTGGDHLGSMVLMTGFAASSTRALDSKPRWAISLEHPRRLLNAHQDLTILRPLMAPLSRVRHCRSPTQDHIHRCQIQDHIHRCQRHLGCQVHLQRRDRRDRCPQTSRFWSVPLNRLTSATQSSRAGKGPRRRERNVRNGWLHGHLLERSLPSRRPDGEILWLVATWTLFLLISPETLTL